MDAADVVLLDWVEGKKTYMKDPGCAPVLVEVRVWLSDAFYAFASALEYSAHKYYPRLL